MKEIRVVLVGKTGSGKSTFGNTLLGRDAFDSERGLNSGTKRCNWSESGIEGLTLSVTDTPGLCDTHRDEDEVLREVGKSVSVACPGPHVIIIVLRCDRRFTQEEHHAVKTLMKLFGKEVHNYLMIVFVGGDSYKGQDPKKDVSLEEMQENLEQELKSAPKELAEVLTDAYNRYCVVDNTGSHEQRKKYRKFALHKILEVVKCNGDKYFTNKMVDEYDREVEVVVNRHILEESITKDEAVRETRQAIVEEKEEPGFFQTVTNITKDYVLPAVVSGATYAVAASACSVM